MLEYSHPGESAYTSAQLLPLRRLLRQSSPPSGPELDPDLRVRRRLWIEVAALVALTPGGIVPPPPERRSGSRAWLAWLERACDARGEASGGSAIPESLKAPLRCLEPQLAPLVSGLQALQQLGPLDLIALQARLAAATDGPAALAPDSMHPRAEGPVMARTDSRRMSGAYYTPQYLADALVDATLFPILAEDSISISDLTILDPAVGTGVFLVSAARYLAHVLAAREHIPIQQARHAVIQNCLFGVDVDEEALRTAVLALQLEGVWNRRLPDIQAHLHLGDALIGSEAERLPWPVSSDHPDARALADAWTRFSLEPRLARGGRQAEAGALWPDADGFLRESRCWPPADAALPPYTHWWLDFPASRVGFHAVLGNPPYLSAVRGGAQLFQRLRASPNAGRDHVRNGDLFYHFLSAGIRLLCPGGRLGMIVPGYWRTRTDASRLRQTLAETSRLRLRLTLGRARPFKSAPGHHTELLVLERSSSPGPAWCCELPTEVRDLPTVLRETMAALRADPSGTSAGRRSLLEPCSDAILLLDSAPSLPGEEQVPLAPPTPLPPIGDFSPCRTWSLPPAACSQGVVMPQATLTTAGASLLPPGPAQVGDGIFWLRDEELEALELLPHERALARPYVPVEGIRPFCVLPPRGWLLYLDMQVARAIRDEPARWPGLHRHLIRFGPAITSTFGPFGLHRARQSGWFEGGERLLIARKTPRVRAARTVAPAYVDQGVNVVRLNPPDHALLLGILHTRRTDRWLREHKHQGDLLQIDKDVLCQLPLPRVEIPGEQEMRLAQRDLKHGGPEAMLTRQRAGRVQTRADLEAVVGLIEQLLGAKRTDGDAHLAGPTARPGRGGRFFSSFPEPTPLHALCLDVLETLVDRLYASAG